ncbi:olfactory receptor 5V1 [Xenopus laevis]|uniref:Olfactory receptor 5V1 n=1 Tax=Xenopus laevis TaxID=8355 RepID=A0A8J1MHN4_XENLA|nr:olfactory receptor 5V1 [Xenopus laevis]
MALRSHFWVGFSESVKDSLVNYPPSSTLDDLMKLGIQIDRRQRERRLKGVMQQDNYTAVYEFLILGFHRLHGFNILLFLFFLLIYIVICLENLLIIVLVVYTCKMPWINWTDEVDFTLFGFSRDLRLQYFQFGIFLLLYLMSLVGNLTITVAICLDQKLHTPMYFFLGNLSFLDICYSSVTVPKMLVALLGGNNKISYRGCMSQLYFYVSCCSTECLLLSVMAYDRYVAICNPMRYTIIMSKKTCFQLATGLWLIGFISSVLHTVFTARLPYCGSHRISHFFCDIPPMLKLSCTDTFMNKVLVLTAGGFLGLSSFVLTLISYVKIISTILNIRTNIGRGRAFSTCASHLTVVTIFFGSISFMYMRPTSSNSFETDKLISFLYAVLTPALNPMIYTLRNKEFKVSLKKTVSKIIFFKKPL